MISLFTRSLFSIAVLGFILPACGPSERAQAISQLNGNASNGEQFYTEYCKNCHAADGRGGPRGVDLIKHRSHHDDAELIDQIIEGGGNMPSFGYLDDQVIADIISYIHSL